MNRVTEVFKTSEIPLAIVIVVVIISFFSVSNNLVKVLDNNECTNIPQQLTIESVQCKDNTLSFTISDNNQRSIINTTIRCEELILLDSKQ